MFLNKTIALQSTGAYISFLLISVKATMTIPYTDFHHLCVFA